MNTLRLYRLMSIQMIIVLLVCFGVATSGQALTPKEQDMLQEAKAQGLVGEQLNGYLGIVTPSPTDELKDLVKKVNAERKELYEGFIEKPSDRSRH